MRTSRLGIMTNRCAITIAAAILTATAVGAEQHQAISRGCTEIVGVLEQGAGLSADEVAKKTSTDVETVRTCTDQWRASQKNPKGTHHRRGRYAARRPGLREDRCRARRERWGGSQRRRGGQEDRH